MLGVHKSTIYRELKRNVTKTGRYNPNFANELVEEGEERYCHYRTFDVSKKYLV